MTRSDIYLCLLKEDGDKLIQKIKDTENMEYMIPDEIITKRDEIYTIFKWEYRAWFKGYEEVDLIELFIDQLADEDKPYKQVILNPDDMETYENYCNGECDHIEGITQIDIY